MLLSWLSSINLHNDSISWCRMQVHPIGTGSVVDGIWRTDSKRSRKKEESGAKKTGEPTLSTTGLRSCILWQSLFRSLLLFVRRPGGAVCGLRPWGARPLWYQIIPRRNKKGHSHTYIYTHTRARAWSTLSELLRNAHTGGLGRETRGIRLVTVEDEKEEDAEDFGKPISAPFFIIFTVDERRVSFPRLSATIQSVKVRCFMPHDDNAAANVSVAFALTDKLENLEDVVLEITL